MRASVELAYRMHGESVFRYLVRLSGDPDLAGDLLQETFRKLIEKPPRDDSNLRGWLFRVATNAFRDGERSGRRRRRTLQRIGGWRVHSDPAPSPERRLHVDEARERAERMMRALSERDRAILLMREEGFTHREIAQAVGTTTGSIGTMIARALDRVAQATQTVEATP